MCSSSRTLIVLCFAACLAFFGQISPISSLILSIMECTTVSNCLIMTPIGDMKLIACPSGLHGLSQVDEDDSDFAPNEEIAVALKDEDEDALDAIKPHTKSTVKWLENYFNGKGRVTNIPLPDFCQSLNEGTFTYKVWMELAKQVSFGKTITYGALANLTDENPGKGATLAVGRAMSNNPYQLLVPCHRVVPSSGGYGKYAKGCKNKVKVWLLKYEGCELKK